MFNTSELDELFRILNSIKGFKLKQPQGSNTTATMAELTKMDNRQPVGKIKSTGKMVMMLSLFDSTKPETSKQHYERFNLYINFQTKSGHLTDPVREAIDLFEHTLDKTTLVWFQTNRSKFKVYNPISRNCAIIHVVHL